jgi:hypothetical protein
LYGAKSEIVYEAMARRHELRHLLKNSTTGRLVCFRDDNGEIFWSQKWWNAGFDTVETFLEPFCRF